MSVEQINYDEGCCFNERRDHCMGAGCACRCHAEVPVPMRPDCGHEADLERYRQRSRDEDTARIRLNHARIELRDWLEALEAWTSNVLGIVRDRRIPSADVIADGEQILTHVRKVLKG